MKQTKWVLRPVCGSKTRNRIREDTVLMNFPLYCPKCRQETLIEVKDLRLTVIKEPAAEPMNLQMMQILGSAAFLYTAYNREEAVKSSR